MKWPLLETIPIALICSFAVQFLTQAFKVVLHSFKTGKWDMSYATSPGGMPSTHAAYVSALAFSIGIQHGLDSDLFAVSIIFGGIVVYDAAGLRRTVGKQSRLLNKLAKQLLPEEREILPEKMGHTFSEIVAGIIFGALVGMGITLLLLKLADTLELG